MTSLPNATRILFQNAHLKQVIAQVRYPVLPRFGDAGFVAPFVEKLKSTYPKVERQEQRKVVLSSGEGVSVGANETLWRLATRDQAYVVVLGETALTLEANRYSSIDELTERFESVLGIGQSTLNLEDRSRLGLRYINEFREPGMRGLRDWSKYLRDEFLGFAASDIFDGVVDRMLQEVRLQRDDGLLVLRHGLTGQLGDTERDESEAYLLDMDYFSTRETELSAAEIIAELRAYSDYMYRFFRWTMKDCLFKELAPQ